MKRTTAPACYMAGGQIDVSARMVEQGWALVYRQYSGDYVGQEDAAKASRAGMWAGEFMRPWEWRNKLGGVDVGPA